MNNHSCTFLSFLSSERDNIVSHHTLLSSASALVDSDAGQDMQQQPDRAAPPGAQGAKGGRPSSLSPEMDKLKICKEDFEASKQSFQQVRQGPAGTARSRHRHSDGDYERGRDRDKGRDRKGDRDRDKDNCPCPGSGTGHLMRRICVTVLRP